MVIIKYFSGIFIYFLLCVILYLSYTTNKNFTICVLFFYAGNRLMTSVIKYVRRLFETNACAIPYSIEHLPRKYEDSTIFIPNENDRLNEKEQGLIYHYFPYHSFTSYFNDNGHIALGRGDSDQECFLYYLTKEDLVCLSNIKNSTT